MRPSVAYDGEDEDVLFTNKGDRVKVQGVMTFKKMGDTTYYNLSAEKVKKAGDGDADSISGTLQFRGTLGSKVPLERVPQQVRRKPDHH